MTFVTNTLADALSVAQTAAATDPSSGVGRRLRGLRGKLAGMAAVPTAALHRPSPIPDSPAPAPAPAVATLNGRAIVPERDGPGPTRQEKRAAKAKAKARQAAVSLAQQIEQIPDATIAWLLAGRTIPVSLSQARVEFAQWATRHAEHRQWLAAWEPFLSETYPGAAKAAAPVSQPAPAPFVVTTGPVPVTVLPAAAPAAAPLVPRPAPAPLAPSPSSLVPRPSLADIIRARRARA